jgi:hypothetical protein
MWHDIGTGVQAILKFSLKNERDCNVGITERRDFFNYAIEMGSCAVIYVPGLIKIGSELQELIGGIHIHTDSKVIL